MSVRLKDTQGVRGGACGSTTSEAFIVDLKAVPEPQILVIKRCTPNHGAARGFKSSSGSDGKGKSSQI